MGWPLSRHVERQAKRLQDMMARTGVDPLKLARLRHGEAFIEASKACIECRHAGECRLWLDRPDAGSNWPAFCPVAALLESVRNDPRPG